MRKKLTCLLPLVIAVTLVSSGTSLGISGGKDPSLVGWWKLDDGVGTTALDSSGNGNDGQIQGDPVWVTGLLDGALQMDGAGDYIDCGNGQTLDIQDQITMSFWIKTDGFTTDWSAIISKGDGSWRMSRSATTGSALHMGFGGTTTSGNPYMDGTITVTDNEWHHGAGVYDGAEARIYVDGVLDVSQAATGQLATATYSVLIGENAQATGRYLNATLDDVRVYNQALTVEELEIVMKGEFAPIAENPSPADEATDVPRDAVLDWTAGEFAAAHNVYLRTSFDDVNAADIDSPLLVSPGQTATTYDPPGLLEYGQTYYWRVDEINAPPTSDTIFKGEVWSFTAEPLYYSVADVNVTSSAPTASGSGGPEVMVNGDGLTDGQHGDGDITMWSGKTPVGEPIWLQFDFDRAYKLYGIHVWNYNGLYEFILGFGLKDITIEYATEPNEWLTLGDYQLDRGPGSTTYAGQRIDLDGLAARSIRINVNSTHFGGPQPGLDNQIQAGVSEIQFLYKPVVAREPEPADSATEVDRATSLTWRPGREADSHQVHFGTDSNAVADGTALVDTVASSTYNPGSLLLGTTYYWKIGEVNEVETPAVWASDIWSFTTQEYVTIDGFESYTDDEGNRVYQTWADGYGSNDNGSQVGHDSAPYAEGTIRHTGAQSMPLYYRNTDGKAYSEAEQIFASPQDWTVNGADTLSLYYQGDPIAFLETSPGNILMSGVGADIYESTDEFRYAYKQLTGNGSITARVESIQNTNEWSKVGVMIRATLESGAMQAHMIATPTDRVEWMARETAGANAAGTATDVNSTPLPVWVRVTRQGNTFTGQYSADGQTWLTIDTTTPATIAMPDTVYVGLLVCSHVTGATCAAEFSSVSTTGTVTGQWQLAAVGVEQPIGNELDTLYLAVEDSSGKSTRVEHPDPYAVVFSTWQSWTTPLSELTAAGVNVTKVKKLCIGVGDKTQPSSGGSGILYIDDVGFGHPIEE